MKEKINQLEDLLTKINESIERHWEIEQIDIDEFDAIQKTSDFPFDEDGRFRATILSYKTDRSFYENDIPKLELLLSNAVKQLLNIKKYTSHLGTKNNKPNTDIIKLIKQGILSTKTVITGDMQGNVILGHLTEDGYLELKISGTTKKFGSLRSAAIAVLGKDIPSQWKFWQVGADTEQESKSLQFYRSLIDKT